MCGCGCVASLNSKRLDLSSDGVGCDTFIYPLGPVRKQLCLIALPFQIMAGIPYY